MAATIIYGAIGLRLPVRCGFPRSDRSKFGAKDGGVLNHTPRLHQRQVKQIAALGVLMHRDPIASRLRQRVHPRVRSHEVNISIVMRKSRVPVNGSRRHRALRRRASHGFSVEVRSLARGCPG